MPVIRDAQGKERVEENRPPPAVPPGPIERRQVSAERMADFAAERARMSEHERAAAQLPRRENRPPGSDLHRESSRRGGGSPSYKPTEAEQRVSSARGASASAAARAAKRPAPDPAPVVEPAATSAPHHDAGWTREARVRAPRPNSVHGQQLIDRDARAARVMEAVERHNGDVEAARRELGMRRNAVAMVVKHARIRAGELPAPPRRGQPRVVTPADIAFKGREEGAPATAAPAEERPSGNGRTEARTTPPGPDRRSTLADRVAAAGRAETIARDVREELAEQLAATRDGISLNLTIRVGTAEMASWGPGRISDFFAGLAKVVQAYEAAER